MRIIAIILFTLLAIGMSLQDNHSTDKQPSRQVTYRISEGGFYNPIIDWETPLDQLILRLDTDWQFVETGEPYPIGYTDDMYSIAARKDTAIQPLLRFIKTTNSMKAKTGAVCCLHLIALNNSVGNRFTEVTVNKEARKALLSLLTHDDLQEFIVRLLMRDPWLSDVPELFKALNESNTDCWPIVNILGLYDLAGFPLHQKMPKNIGDMVVPITETDYNMSTKDFDYEGQLQEVLRSIKKNAGQFVKIEYALFHSKLWGQNKYKLGNVRSDSKVTGVQIGKFLERVTGVFYFDLGNKFQYYVENGKVYICSPMTAKKRLLQYWATLPAVEKIKFEQDLPLNKAGRS